MTTPAAWPLLSFLGSRAVLYSSGQALTHRFSPAGPGQRFETLEAAEARLAQGKAISLVSLLWRPQDEHLGRFLDYAFRLGLSAGGLRVHSLTGDDVPLEALGPSSAPGISDGDREQAIGNLTVLRLTEVGFDGGRLPNAGAGAGPALLERPSERRVFIYCNPGEEPELPHARRESEAVAEILEDSCDIRYLARLLSETELREHMEWAEIIFYFGHGENISGAPAIPGETGWISFPVSGPNMEGKINFFCACYRSPTAGLRFSGGCGIFPICRIADREAPFITDLVRAWSKGASLYEAYGSAAEMDHGNGDIRRFVYRMQGMNQAAGTPGLFG